MFFAIFAKKVSHQISLCFSELTDLVASILPGILTKECAKINYLFNFYYRYFDRNNNCTDIKTSYLCTFPK